MAVLRILLVRPASARISMASVIVPAAVLSNVLRLPEQLERDGAEQGPLPQALSQEGVVDCGLGHRLRPPLVGGTGVWAGGSTVEVAQAQRAGPSSDPGQ